MKSEDYSEEERDRCTRRNKKKTLDKKVEQRRIYTELTWVLAKF